MSLFIIWKVQLATGIVMEGKNVTIFVLTSCFGCESQHQPIQFADIKELPNGYIDMLI